MLKNQKATANTHGKNLRQLAVSFCGGYLPQVFAVDICCEYLLQLLCL